MAIATDPSLPFSERVRDWADSIAPARARRARRIAGIAGLALIGAGWGVAIGMGGVAALIIFLAALAALFCLQYNFRAGVAVLIVIMPISQSYAFPHEMFGIKGLNPLNVLLAATLYSYVVGAAGKGELKHFVPRAVVWMYILPILAGALLGMGHAGQIPSFFRELDMIYFSDAPGYLRDMFLKPMLFVLYALLVASAVLHAKEPERFLKPTVISIFVMSSVSLAYVAFSGVSLSQLSSSSSTTATKA